MCLHFQDGSCRRCQDPCPAQAIDLAQPESVVELTTPSLILATGYQPAAPACRAAYANDPLANVITGKVYLWELVANCLDYEPWSEEEQAQARAARDKQFERDGIKLEEE